MQTVSEFAAILSSALFAGAALYINLVEHPARMQCGTETAAAVFGPSYRRATVMQVTLAMVATISSIVSWWLDDSILWAVGALLIFAVIPFTLIVILPTNKELLAPSLDRTLSAVSLRRSRSKATVAQKRQFAEPPFHFKPLKNKQTLIPFGMERGVPLRRVTNATAQSKPSIERKSPRSFPIRTGLLKPRR